MSRNLAKSNQEIKKKDKEIEKLSRRVIDSEDKWEEVEEVSGRTISYIDDLEAENKELKDELEKSVKASKDNQLESRAIIEDLEDKLEELNNSLSLRKRRDYENKITLLEQENKELKADIEELDHKILMYGLKEWDDEGKEIK